MLPEKPANRMGKFTFHPWYAYVQSILESVVVDELLEQSKITMVFVKALLLSIPFCPFEFLVFSFQDHYWFILILRRSFEIQNVSWVEEALQVGIG